VKLFVIAPRFPYPIEKGDKLRLYHQIRYLSKRYKIYLVALSDIPVKEEYRTHLEQFTEEIHVFRLYKLGIYWSVISRFFSGLPLQVLYFFNGRIKRKINKLHQRIKPDITFNQLIRTTEYSKNLEGVKVLDYMDAFSTGMEKRLDNSSWPYSWVYRIEKKRLIRYERDVYSSFDAHTIISKQDKERLEDHVNGSIEIIPNGVDTEFFRAVETEKKYDICFVGNMGYRPNVIAAEYLVQEILPGILNKFPGIKIALAGTRPDPRVKKLAGNNVIVTGWLEDIRQAYNESGIFVAPIFTGIGQQNKILEAMSMEIPCVCTSSVKEPIGGKDGVSVLVANDGSSFVDKIEVLLKDKKYARHLGAAGRQLVEENYSWEKQVNNLINLFEQKYV